MSRRRAKYSTEFKTKLVLEVLKEDRTLSEIASENGVTPTNLKNWKKLFLDNAELAMEPSRAVKEYKDQITELHVTVDDYAKKVGQLTLEKDWAVGKLKSLGLSDKKKMIEPELKILPVVKQCELLDLSRSSVYYTPSINEKKTAIKEEIKSIFEAIPIYGAKKVHCQLIENGYTVSLNTVTAYRKELGLKAVLAVREPLSLTQPNIQHPKFSYKLKGVILIGLTRCGVQISPTSRLMEAWSTWLPLSTGTSKAVLSWRISNIMDTDLVMGVLNEALYKYDKPEIFNTDQGSQYTSYIHTQTLKNNGITISMDGKGRATDNIFIERFWRSAKVERIYLNQYNTIKELKEDVADYMDFYNHRRFHETLDYKKPMGVYYDSLQINDENYIENHIAVS